MNKMKGDDVALGILRSILCAKGEPPNNMCGSPSEGCVGREGETGTPL